jgi:D-arabinose 1-dehydrogenase-like Zn-dependent alcohol dehydrogenase
MKAMAYSAYGGPLEPLDLPEPELVPGSALLEVLACGICYSDVKTWQGAMAFSPDLPLPHIPGHEIAARVVAADPPGSLAPGTTVVVYHLRPCRACDRCRAGEENLCRAPLSWTGFTHPGGLRERMVVPLDRLTVVPPGIDAIHAAPLTCALGTAYRAVVSRGRVLPGTRVGVIGLGGVGIHALQIARAAGADAVGLDVSDRAIETARALGLEAGRADDLDAERAAAGDAGLDVVVEAVGRETTMAQALRLVRPGGRIVAVGYSATSEFVVPSPRFVLEEVELVGSRYVRLDELGRAIQLVADGRVEIVVDEVKPLAEAGAALGRLRDGQVVGRIVVDVSGAGSAGGAPSAEQ